MDWAIKAFTYKAFSANVFSKSYIPSLVKNKTKNNAHSMQSSQRNYKDTKKFFGESEPVSGFTFYEYKSIMSNLILKALRGMVT